MAKVVLADLVANGDLTADVLVVPDHKVEARKASAHDVRQRNSIIPVFWQAIPRVNTRGYLPLLLRSQSQIRSAESEIIRKS